MASLVSKCRFKTLPVTDRGPIKAFVQKHKLNFAKGRGFYQLNKPELIQDYKEVIVRRKSDKSFLTGEAVRDALGVAKTSKKFKLDLSEIEDFDVFVQSTSVNRVLLPGTEFLYEVEEGGDGEAEAGSSSPAKGRAGKRKKDEPAAAEPEPKKKTPAKRGAATATSSKKAAAATKPKATGKRGAAKKTPATEEPDEAKEPEATPTPSKKAKMDADPPPGGPVEIVFSFDTTGSMYPCLTQVRRKVSDIIKRLQTDIPGLRVAVIAHGDYCDARSTYVTKILNFSSDKDELCRFVENVPSTGGGDWEECYELVLHEARTKLSWTPGTQRSLVLIGDAIPHRPNEAQNTLSLDWKKEASALYDELGVRIYSVQALNNSAASSFYKGLAEATYGYHLHLDQFSSITDFIMAICFREQSMEQLQVYEEEVRKRGSGLNRSLHSLFDTLAGRKTAYTGGGDTDGLVPVNPARFQVLDVDERCDIKSYVQRNGLIFKTGRGFYEFTKPEKVSDKKEVVLVDKVSGDMFTGPEACRVIGAGGAGKIKPTCLDKWRVFVQSTSYNRVLMPSTGFLYEVDPEH